MEDPGKSGKAPGEEECRWPQACGVASVGPASMPDLLGVEDPHGPMRRGGVVPANTNLLGILLVIGYWLLVSYLYLLRRAARLQLKEFARWRNRQIQNTSLGV